MLSGLSVVFLYLLSLCLSGKLCYGQSQVPDHTNGKPITSTPTILPQMRQDSLDTSETFHSVKSEILSTISTTDLQVDMAKAVENISNTTYGIQLKLRQFMVGACQVDITKNTEEFHVSPSDNPLLHVTCNIGPNRRWSFLNFRNFTRHIFGFGIALDLKCNGSGEVILPWPMRAYHLKYISVQDCNILNFTSEYFKKEIESIPDTLEYFSIINCFKHTTLKDFIDYLTLSSTGYLTKHAKCGPENVRANIIRNSPEKFTNIKEQLKKLPPNLVKKVARGYYRNKATSRKVISCRFKYLVKYDRSQSDTLGVKHLEMMLKNNEYPNLEVFNLSRTRLQEIPPSLIDWRLYFPKLKYLDLRYNNITDFQIIKDHGSVEEEPTMGVVDLRYNNISVITRRLLRSLRFHKFVKVDIRDNPLNCICENRELVEYLRGENNLTLEGSQYSYLKDLVCANPPEVRGRRILDLTAEELGCEVEISTILTDPIITLCVLVFLLIITIIIIVRYRNEIIILAFTRFNILLPCHSAEDEGKKEYDAFVAYSQQDAEWVIKTMATKLEKNIAGGSVFKLCLHHRDFAIGAAISDNIIRSVETSRHTILVVSRNFLKSEWCLLEFRTALHQSLLERKKHLIIVLLEDISKENMEVDLKRCLQTLTFVKVDDILFWDKLIYALSDKKKAKVKRANHIVGYDNYAHGIEVMDENALNNNQDKV